VIGEVDIICTYYKDGKYPIPRKLRYKDYNGILQTVGIDNIKMVEDITPNGLHRLTYHCESEIDSTITTYHLTYLVKDMKWTVNL